VVRQDASYALPGFYIVSFDEQFRALDEMPPSLHALAWFVIREVRSAMRNALGIDYAHLYYEEKPARSTNVHYWLLPLDVADAQPISRLRLKEYLGRFRCSERRRDIYDYNRRIRRHLVGYGVAERARVLTTQLALKETLQR
jgi:hypothetical protein